MFARLLGVLLTFWNDYVLFTIKKIMIVVLQKRPIPKHVSFIMDGNRRFAMASHIPRAEGHLHGFEKLLEVIEWCLDLGVREVSLYGFSIENFKRSKDEVDSLMELAFTKLSEAMKEKYIHFFKIIINSLSIFICFALFLFIYQIPIIETGLINME